MSRLRREAQSLGIKPEGMSAEKLKLAVKRRQQFLGMLRVMKDLGIPLPGSGVSYEDLERLIRTEVAKRLKHVKVGNPVRYQGRSWTVKAINDRPRSKDQRGQRQGVQYVLVLHNGGRECNVMDTTLAKEMR